MSSTHYHTTVRRFDNATREVRLWAQSRKDTAFGLSAVEYPVYLEMRPAGQGLGQAAVLTRQEARDMIATLQAVLDEAGPEPIIEPECDYVMDRDGDYWVKNAAGYWACGRQLGKAQERAEAGQGSYTFEGVLAAFHPLRPFKVERAVVMEPREVEREVELDTVTA